MVYNVYQCFRRRCARNFRPVYTLATLFYGGKKFSSTLFLLISARQNRQKNYDFLMCYGNICKVTLRDFRVELTSVLNHSTLEDFSKRAPSS